MDANLLEIFQTILHLHICSIILLLWKQKQRVGEEGGGRRKNTSVYHLQIKQSETWLTEEMYRSADRSLNLIPWRSVINW